MIIEFIAIIGIMFFGYGQIKVFYYLPEELNRCMTKKSGSFK